LPFLGLHHGEKQIMDSIVDECCRIHLPALKLF